MKWLEKVFLGLMTAVAPVYIACAYGSPFNYDKQGMVVDAETKEGIPGIEVTCLVADQETSTAVSSQDGSFVLSYDEPCELVRCVDVDGEDNGGLYQTRLVPVDENADSWTVEMSK